MKAPLLLLLALAAFLPSASADDADLKITIIPPAKKLIADEPFTIRLQFTNPSDRAILVIRPNALAKWTGWGTVFVSALNEHGQDEIRHAMRPYCAVDLEAEARKRPAEEYERMVKELEQMDREDEQDFKAAIAAEKAQGRKWPESYWVVLMPGKSFTVDLPKPVTLSREGQYKLRVSYGMSRSPEYKEGLQSPPNAWTGETQSKDLLVTVASKTP